VRRKERGKDRRKDEKRDEEQSGKKKRRIAGDGDCAIRKTRRTEQKKLQKAEEYRGMGLDNNSKKHKRTKTEKGKRIPRRGQEKKKVERTKQEKKR
jgi:hypothetical protein